MKTSHASTVHRLRAETPDPTSPQPEDPHRVPVEPPAEPPDPNPVHVPSGQPRIGDLPGSNPNVLARREWRPAPSWREHPVRVPHRDERPTA